MGILNRTRPSRSIHYGVLAIAIGLLAGLLFDFPTTMSLEIRVLLALILLSFAAIHRLPPLQRLLALPLVLFVGDISYPLYLVHNNLGIGLTTAFARLMPHAPAYLWGLSSIAAVALLAWVIARFAEPVLTPVARRLTDRLRVWLAVRRA